MAESGASARPPLLKPDDALFLDFDGTIVAFAQQPDGVVVEEPLRRLLAGLHAHLGGALAIVTGRSIAALDALLGRPRYAAAGLHGLELRFQGGCTTSSANPDGAARIANRLQARFAGDPRVVIEDKGAAVALHWRQAPDRSSECVAAMREAANSPAFEILEGHAVVEARPRGTHKGAAIAALSKHGPFAGRPPVFVGDDRTDEDGFHTVSLLGGYGIKVGPGATAARYRIDSVPAVRAWLEAALAAPGAGASR
jgi:trehalose 6-phosphate phosphatase